jgi:hypothetical protein
MGSFANRFKNITTQTSTPKFMEEVVVEVISIDEVAKLF